MGGKRITYKEQRIIEDLLRGRLVSVGEGYCKYKDSGSDDHVVAEARMKGVGGCTKFHVRHIRREMFGDLQKHSERTTEYHVPGVVLDQLRSLESFDSLIETKVGKMRDDVNLIMDYLTRTEGVDWNREQNRFGLKKAG